MLRSRSAFCAPAFADPPSPAVAAELRRAGAPAGKRRSAFVLIAACLAAAVACAFPAFGSAGAETAATPEASGPLRVTVAEAILLALGNNRALLVERHNPPIRRTFEEEERALFDPDLTGQLARERLGGVALGTGGFASRRAENVRAQVSLAEIFPTGTLLALTAAETARKFPGDDDGRYATPLALTASQALLRGRGLAVNLASLRQARLDTRSSEYELRGFAESLVAQTEETYWDYALAKGQIEIFERSVTLAERQMEETRERIRLGRLASTELVAAEAELALRREDLINARSARDTTRLRLLRLLNPGGAAFDRALDLLDEATAPTEPVDPLGEHLQLADRMRPDLNQARLEVERGDLEVVKTRNGLLPRLDLFLTLGRTGFARSFFDSARDLGGDTYDFVAGVNVEYPLGNRAAKARDARAALARRQSREAVENLAQLVEVDVRAAHIEVLRAREQVTATAASRRLQAEKARVETEKFRLGKSTSLLVAQTQRDEVAGEVAELQALVNYRKAVVELFRLDGSLLSRRGLAAPGDAPPDRAKNEE